MTESSTHLTSDAASELAEAEIETSLITFAEETLGFRLYPWQCAALEAFDEAGAKQVLVTLATPNGSGKSARVIPALALGWLSLYPRSTVVITTADGKQLDGQVMPAVMAHRARFPTWRFVDREITTPTGARLIAFTTDQAGRAEGWHKFDDLDGPLLVIVDEAKSVPEEIFTALDRCTYNALLLCSSPGRMQGRFYESHLRRELGFRRIRVGLADCPHIGVEKIERIMRQHGPDSPLTRSALHGEFMLAEGEARFDREGLEHLARMVQEPHGTYGRLERGRATGSVAFFPDDEGWLWLDEPPRPRRSYLMFCDPNTCEQGAGTSERDKTACGILRDAYLDEQGRAHTTTLAAALHWPSGVKWDSDVLARRMALLAEFYGGAMAVVEANNFGSALMKDLAHEGVALWRRTKIDDVNPSKELKINGYLSTGRSREWWVQKCAAAVREKELCCRYAPAATEFQTFVIKTSGRAEALEGCHDDWVAGIGIGLVVGCYTMLAPPAPVRSWGESYGTGATVAGGSYGNGALG